MSRVKKIFFIHIMKTGGTSFRKMLIGTLNATQVFPNDDDLSNFRKGWYPDIKDLIFQRRNHQLRDFSILCGHYPFFVGKLILDNPVCITFLREPISRTISMIEHRKRKSKKFAKLKYEEILNDSRFVSQQIKNYQTKFFALDRLDRCPKTVNVKFEINDRHFDRAIQNLNQLNGLGLTEYFSESIELIGNQLNLKFDRVFTANQGQYKRDISQEVVNRIISLNYYDIQLYERAKTIFLERWKDYQNRSQDLNPPMLDRKWEFF